MCSVRVLIVALATTTALAAAAVQDWPTCPLEAVFRPMLNESEKVVRDPYGDFDTTGAWSYFVPREARDVNVTFRWWFPTSSEHWPSTPLIVPADYAGDVPGERLGDANLTVVCHGLPPRLRSRADALVYSLLKRRPEGALLEVEWNIVSGCEYASAVRSDVYYCPPLKGPTEITLYQQAAGDSRLVARALSRALTGLSFDHGYDLARVHLLGFGVGAHVVGFVASDLHVISEFGRLTLLDPAAPLFVEKLGLAHLNASGRARVSEAVHTSAAEACGLGIANRLADLDVFVDGGERQPQCHPNYLCSHIWALYYYTRTVERCTGGGVSETGLLPGYWTPEKRGVYNVSMRKLACPTVSAPSLGSEQSSRAAPMCVQCLYAWSLVALAFFAAPR